MHKHGIPGLVIVVLILLTLAACETTTEILTGSYQNEIGQATSADVSIELAFENGTLSALDPGATNLIEADLEYVGEIGFDVSGSRNRTIRLSEDSKDRVYTGGETLDWIIGLSPDVPIDLALVANSGAMSADLGDLNLTSSDFEVNSGTLIADFPTSEAAIPGSIAVNSGSATLNLPGSSTVAFGETSTNSGNLTINVADSAAFSAQDLSVSSGQITINVGENAHFALADVSANSGDITITLPAGVAFQTDLSINSGRVIFDLPDDAAVQVDLRDLGSGAVAVPDGFTMTTRGSDEDGEALCQSANFEGAEAQIIIVAEIASGDLIIR